MPIVECGLYISLSVEVITYLYVLPVIETCINQTTFCFLLLYALGSHFFEVNLSL